MMQNESLPKIKPCRVCGDAWLYVSDGDYYSGYESYGYKVECNCKGSFTSSPWSKTRKEAIEYWNNRYGV